MRRLLALRPAKPGGESVLTLDDSKPPMAPELLVAKISGKVS